MFDLLQKPNVIQKWLEDNGKAAGDLKKPGANFDNLDLHGKAFGDKVKPFKFQFKIKKNHNKNAIKVIIGTNMTTVDGFRVFGLIIQTTSACKENGEREMEKKTTYTKKLPKIAQTSSQHAYSQNTKGFQNNLS